MEKFVNAVVYYWGVISLAIIGFIWGGRITQRVYNIEKEDFVKTSECDARRSSCQRMQEKEFDHGSKEFQEIKSLISENARIQRKQYECLLGKILEIKK